MARNYTLQWQGGRDSSRLTSTFARPGLLPTTLRPADLYDPTTDEDGILAGVVPDEFTGSGTLKLGLLIAANTTTAADDARFDIVTEFRTPGAAEAMNSANFDGTADSGTVTFSTTAYSLQLLTITLTPVVTPVAGDSFRIKVTRDANHGSLDDLAVDAYIVQYEFYEEA